MCMQVFHGHLDCPFFEKSEVESLDNDDMTSPAYVVGLCDRFERFLDREEAEQQLFHFGMVFPCSFRLRTVSLTKYMRQENRLIALIRDVARAPYYIRLWSLWTPGHRALSLSSRELRLLKRTYGQVVCLRDNDLCERIMRAALREGCRLWLFLEDQGVTVCSGCDLSVEFVCRDKADCHRIDVQARKYGLYLKTDGPKL